VTLVLIWKLCSAKRTLTQSLAWARAVSRVRTVEVHRFDARRLGKAEPEVCELFVPSFL
jgi:hypothetical protein